MGTTLDRPVLKLDDHTLLEQLLSQIRAFRAHPGEDDMAVVRRWLLTTETGMALNDYIAEEAGILEAAAERMSASDHQEVRELGREVAGAADRLSALAGVPASLLGRSS